VNELALEQGDYIELAYLRCSTLDGQTAKRDPILSPNELLSTPKRPGAGVHRAVVLWLAFACSQPKSYPFLSVNGTRQPRGCMAGPRHPGADPLAGIIAGE
jgi:hypothetical protein